MQAGEQVFIGAFVAQRPSDDLTKTESGGQRNGRCLRPKTVALDNAVTAPRPRGLNVLMRDLGKVSPEIVHGVGP